MKKILGIALSIVLLLLIGYFITGIITERTLKKDITLINQTSGFELNLKDYHRGWFTSNASFDWIFVVPARAVTDNNKKTSFIPAKTYTVAMPLTIYHGPVMFANKTVRFGFGYAKTSLDLPKEYLEQFNELFNPSSIKPKVDLSVLVSFLNRSRFLIDVPDFKLISKEDGSQFQWQGMNNVITLSSSLNRISGDLDIHGFHIIKNDRNLAFSKIESHYNLRKTTNGLLLGDAKVRCDSIIASENKTQLLHLDGLAVESRSNIKDDLFDGTIQLSFNRINLHNTIYGPLQFNLLIRNLDSQALSDINTKIGNLDNNLTGQQFLWTVLPDLPKLLNKGVHVEIKDSVLQVPEGRIAVTLDVGLDKGDLDNPLALMQKLQGEGKVIMSKPVFVNMVVKSTRQQLMQEAMQKQTQEHTRLQKTQRNEHDITIDKKLEENNLGQRSKDDVKSEDVSIQTNEGRRGPLRNPADILPSEILPTSKIAANINIAEIEHQARIEGTKRINKMIDEGVLVQDEKDYIVKLKYQNGKLMINEKLFDSSMINF